MTSQRRSSFFGFRSWQLLRAAAWKVLRRKDHVEVDGSIIPSPDRRWCGPEFKEDRFYLQSAEGEAKRLIEHFGCNRETRVLDVGCGQGRLPIGILRVLGELDYTGIDVDRRSIEWCRRHIAERHPTFTFKHLDLYNERYNRSGIRIDHGFRFEVEADSIDIVYLYSVFSHTTEEDMRVYLRDFLRVLDDGGRVFFTTFVEENVPNVTINPKNYRLRCSGPLHVVRYDRGYLFSLLEESGYSVLDLSHATEADGQSALYLSKR